MGVVTSSMIPQSFRLPPPPITEKNCPDQTGRVHIVTGGYTGVGFELAAILYAHNATVYIAGRSKDKYSAAYTKITDAHKDSKGKLDFLLMDFSNLPTIEPAVREFRAKEQRLDVLTLNAGVMMPPRGSKDEHGHELQIGTNCLGSYLAYDLLRPVLAETAKTAPTGSVRVSWAGSLAVDLISPKPGGMVFVDGEDKDGGKIAGPKTFWMQSTNYGQSKAANLFLASQLAARDAGAGVLHTCFNPGNLKTELQRHGSFVERLFVGFILYPARYGGYTELWCAVSEQVTPDRSGGFVAPWGRFTGYRDDIAEALKGKGTGTGKAERFVRWCEQETAAYKGTAGGAAAVEASA